jgi:hypothetical protein
MADVTQTDDADHPLALVDHGQPADLQFLHMMGRIGPKQPVSQRARKSDSPKSLKKGDLRKSEPGMVEVQGLRIIS